MKNYNKIEKIESLERWLTNNVPTCQIYTNLQNVTRDTPMHDKVIKTANKWWNRFQSGFVPTPIHGEFKAEFFRLLSELKDYFNPAPPKGDNRTETYKEFKIKSVFLGNKVWEHCDTQNRNNHKVTAKNTVTGEKVKFDFWGSLMNPKMEDRNDLMHAFYCFVSDAIAGEMDFKDFVSEYGYEIDSVEKYKEIKRTHKACKKSLTKLRKIYDGDIYDLINNLQEDEDL